MDRQLPTRFVVTLLAAWSACGRINVSQVEEQTDAGMSADANRGTSGILAGCELYFAMEEDSWTLGVLDSCSANVATVFGTAQIVVDDPVRGRVGEFVGAGNIDCIQVPDRASLRGGTAVTMSAWVDARPLLVDGAYGIISKRLASGVSDEYGMWIETGAGQTNFLSTEVDGYNDRFALPAEKFVDKWRHVTIVYDGTRTATERIAVYTEGLFRSFARETSSAVSDFTNLAPLSIGCLPQNGIEQSMKGRLDDVVVWSRALSAAEVSAWYTATKK
jgi:hypothetical protein